MYHCLLRVPRFLVRMHTSFRALMANSCQPSDFPADGDCIRFPLLSLTPACLLER
jgi:hypothetical protein